ncbi:MAG: SAM-dependent methyltransferase [Desulfobacterales bacterium]|nr:MAG: SAM-dependent methyltransferase [Desulfobacterales bacterium]
MHAPPPTTYDDIDWNLLWKNSRARKSWTSKGAKEWDKKAPSFSAKVLDSPYVNLVLAQIPVKKHHTVLDIGCGPGTLALPLARKVTHVSALDYSEKMIEILKGHIMEKAYTNITPYLCSWEDDWEKRGVEPADIAIASRSMSVDNLSGAIDKINSFAKKYVFLSDRISPTPYDPDAFAVLGRKFDAGPDYIYTLNMLYSKKIHANITVIELERDVFYPDIDQIMDTYKWMFKELTLPEEKKLENYILSCITPSSEKEGYIFHHNHPPKWALIWWRIRR